MKLRGIFWENPKYGKTPAEWREILQRPFTTRQTEIVFPSGHKEILDIGRWVPPTMIVDCIKKEFPNAKIEVAYDSLNKRNQVRCLRDPHTL